MGNQGDFTSCHLRREKKGKSKVHKRRGQLQQMNRKKGTKEMKPIPVHMSGTYQHVGLECIAHLAARNDICEGPILSPHHTEDHVNDSDARRSKQQEVLEVTQWTSFLEQECSKPSSNLSMNQNDSQESISLCLNAFNSSVQLGITPKQDKGSHNDSLTYRSNKHRPPLLHNSSSSNQLPCPHPEGRHCTDPLCINHKREGSTNRENMDVSGCPNRGQLHMETTKQSRDDIKAASTLWSMLQMRDDKKNKPSSAAPRKMRYSQTQLNQMALHELVELLAALSDRTINQVLKLKKGRKKLAEKINNALQRKLEPSFSTQVG